MNKQRDRQVREFLEAFREKARSEVPYLERIASELTAAKRAQSAKALLHGDDTVGGRFAAPIRLRFQVLRSGQVFQLQFLADPETCRISVLQGAGSYAEALQEADQSEAFKALLDGLDKQAPVETLTVDQFDRAEVESQVQRFLRNALS